MDHSYLIAVDTSLYFKEMVNGIHSWTINDQSRKND